MYTWYGVKIKSESPKRGFPAVTVQPTIEQRARVFDALSDPTRLRIVEWLAEIDEMSSSEIANRLNISLALFCHHSRTLLDAGLIQTRREGQTKYHSLNRAMLVQCFGGFKGIGLRTED